MTDKFIGGDSKEDSKEVNVGDLRNESEILIAII